MSQFQVSTIFNPFRVCRASRIFPCSTAPAGDGLPLNSIADALNRLAAESQPISIHGLTQQVGEAIRVINGSNLPHTDRNKAITKLKDLLTRARNGSLEVFGFVGVSDPFSSKGPVLINKSNIEGVDRPVQYVIYRNHKGQVRALNLDGSHQKIELEPSVILSKNPVNESHNRKQTLDDAWAIYLQDKYPGLASAVQRQDGQQVLKLLRNQVSRPRLTTTGFGPVPHVHTDLNAYGNPLKVADEFINRITPFIGNTHGTSAIAEISTETLKEATAGIFAHFGADQNEYDILVRGAGFTGAFGGYLDSLRQHLTQNDIPLSSVKVGFSLFEHHSNSLPFNTVFGIKDSADFATRIAQIADDDNGVITHNAIVAFLSANQANLKRDSKLAIVLSLSLQSNVTGVKTNPSVIQDAVNTFFSTEEYKDLDQSKLYISLDAAAFTPHAKINLSEYVRPDRTPLFDAIAFSPYKVDGGQQGCGIAIVNRRITGKKPAQPAGGTVRHVSQDTRDIGENPNVQYVTDDADRYDLHNGGSPNVVGVVRSYLGLKIKDMVGEDTLKTAEKKWTEKAYNALNNYQGGDRGATRLRILGPTFDSANVERGNTLPIIIERQTEKGGWVQIDPHVITHVLQNYFGIATRAGCNCAGPYGHHLANQVGFVADVLNQYVQDLDANKTQNIVRPGWNRSTMSALLRDDEVQYFIDAYKLVVDHLDQFLNGYNYIDGKITCPTSRDISISTPVNSTQRPIYEFKGAAEYRESPIKLQDRYNAVEKYIDGVQNQNSNVVAFIIEANLKFDTLLHEELKKIPNGDSKTKAEKDIRRYLEHKGVGGTSIDQWFVRDRI